MLWDRCPKTVHSNCVRMPQNRYVRPFSVKNHGYFVQEVVNLNSLRNFDTNETHEGLVSTSRPLGNGEGEGREGLRLM
jgi:hypothetical protein